MPSFLHDALVELFRRRPELIITFCARCREFGDAPQWSGRVAACPITAPPAFSPDA